MKHTLFAAALLAATLAAPALADDRQQERWPRWYLGLGAGLSFMEESDISGSSTGNVDFDPGANAYLSLGYRLHFGMDMLDSLRFELEGGYHGNDLDSARLNGAAVPVSHSTTAWSVMGNALFDVRNASQWTPYVGAGAGWANVELRRNSGLGNISENDKTLAYQFMAGVAYAPASIPLTEWTLGYRYFALKDPEFATATGKIELDDAVAHSVEAGARFRF